MNKPIHLSGLRTLGLGLLFAAMGFTYALATASRGTDGPELGSRAINSNCVRPPTVIITDSDLGLVVVGTQFSRQIVTQFGFKPHLFVFGPLKPADGITLSDSGEIAGIKDAVEPEGFVVRVFDGEISTIAPQTEKLFFLRGVEHQTSPLLPLQFVNASPLPTAVANEPYAFTLHANGGNPPYTFGVETDEDFAAIPPGLALGPDGLLFGKPFLPLTTTTFTVVLFDSVGTVIRQPFTMTVLPGTISSEFVATTGSLKLDFGREGDNDTVTLKVALNKTDLNSAGVRKVQDLDKLPFELNFGGVVIPPREMNLRSTGTDTGGGTVAVGEVTNTFDKFGKIYFPNQLQGMIPAPGNTTNYTIALNPTSGLLTVKIKDINMIKTLKANFRTFRNPVIPVNVKVGVQADRTTDETDEDTTDDPVIDPNAQVVNYNKTDIIRFQYRRSGTVGKGTARSNDKFPPGGLFLVKKVTGSVEKQSGIDRDLVFLQMSGFCSDVDGKALEIGPTNLIQIFVGSVCLGEFPASSLKGQGGRLTFKNDDQTFGVRNVIIDNAKRSFYIDTWGIDPRRLLGIDFLEAGDAHLVPLTLTIADPTSANPPVFDGQSPFAFFRKGNKLINK